MKFLKSIIIIGLVIILNSYSVDAKKEGKYIWKMADVVPGGVGYASFVDKVFAPKIIEVTQGEVNQDWYHGSIMGDEEDYLAKMRINQLQGSIMSVGGTLMVCPEMSVLQLPFLFNDLKEVKYVREKMRKIFSDIVKKNGFKMLMMVDQDFDQIYSTKYQMNTSADFIKSKFVAHAGFVEFKMLKALGVSPIPLGVPEVASATRSGVIDTCICPSLWTLGTQLYTIDKYVNTLKWRYSPGMVILSSNVWDNLPEKHQKAIDAVLPEMEERFNVMSANDNKKALKAMINYGLKEVKMSTKQINDFKNKLLPVWDDLSGKKFPAELLDEVKMHLKQYRSEQSKNT